MGKGPLPACAPAPALCCMHRPSRMPSPPVCLRPGNLTAAPPGHRRLSGASPCRPTRVRETQALQLQPNKGLFEVRRRPHRRPLLVAAPPSRANVHWHARCAGHCQHVERWGFTPTEHGKADGAAGRLQGSRKRAGSRMRSEPGPGPRGHSTYFFTEGRGAHVRACY